MDIICKHGCGRQGRYLIGKNYCCEKNVSKCPAIRAKLAQKQIGVEPWNKGKTGSIPWNKGKSNIEFFGKERADEISAKISVKLTGNPNLGVAGTQETEDQRREKIRKSINKRYENGWMPKAGRCKKIDYNSPIAGLIKVDGTWEIEVAKYLDRIGVKWKRNKNRFAYTYEGKERFYTPDFYIEDIDSYLEVKGFETDKDRSKWNQFNHKLLIWKKQEIKAIKNGDDILKI
jgi:hypothetical protein